jgi:hypothetical protein
MKWVEIELDPDSRDEAVFATTVSCGGRSRVHDGTGHRRPRTRKSVKIA